MPTEAEQDRPKPLPFARSDEHPEPVETAQVEVDCARSLGPVRRLWTSLGYDEINWTYAPAGKRLLRGIGALGDRAYHVRPHYVFCSGTGFGIPHWGSGNVYHEDSDGKPFYDFTIADQVYDAIVGAGHHALVELAFTPLALVPDYAKEEFPYEGSPTQYSAYENGLWSYPPGDYAKWGDLVGALVRHCVERYGADEVSHWYWELWNEPDIKYWRGTPERFCELYRVTAAAVRDVMPDARVGGPAVTGGGAEFLRGFLEDCDRNDTPLDFISFHTKGAHFRPWRTYGPIGAPPPERQSPSLAKMLGEVRRMLAIVADFPRYAELPCLVDECDASVPAHWGIHDNPNFCYRNTEYYAVFQCKLMKKLLDLNENASASVELATTWSFYFEGERYFEGTRSLATTSGIEKPILNAYRMLARLGVERLAVRSSAAVGVESLDAVGSGWPEEVDALATRDTDGRIAVLVWRHVDDQYRTSSTPADVTIRLTGLPADVSGFGLEHWRVDHDHSNSHTRWRELGASQDPTPAELDAIKARQGLERFAPDVEVRAEDGVVELAARLPLPAASLFVLEPGRGPGQ